MKKTLLLLTINLLLAIAASAQLATPLTNTLSQTSFCAGNSVNLQFKVMSGSTPLTIIGSCKVELAVFGAGSYSVISTALPTNTISLPANSSTSLTPISGTIPSTITAGMYRVRVTFYTNGTTAIGGQSPSGINTYTLNVVGQPATPTITANGSTAICPGATLQLTTNSIGSLNWSTSQTTQSITINTPGSYTVSNTNMCGTSTSAPFIVYQRHLPTVNILSTPTTGCDSVTLYSSGTYYNSLSWSSGQMDSIASFTNSGLYYAIATNTCGSVNSNTISVVINPSPTLTVTKNSSIKCAGQIDTLVASGANTYNWAIGGNTNTLSISPTAQIVYNVSGTDLNGCSGLGSFTVFVNPLPALTIATNNTLLCVGQTATLSANGASTYTWSTSENTNLISVSPTVSTTYTLTGNSNLGCSNAITFMQNVSLCTGVEVLENIGNFSIYPNPTKNTLFINSDFDLDKVEIINCFGSTVKKINLNGSAQIDISDLQNGLYFLKVFESNSENSKVSKIIKER